VCIFINMKIIITENQQESLKKNLMNIIDRFGFAAGNKAVGSFDNMVKILYDGDVSRVGEILELPYFKNIKSFGIPTKFWTKILSNVFNQKIKRHGEKVYDENGNIIYNESYNYWEKRKYNKNGQLIYVDSSRGWWEKYEYDGNGNRTYFEDSNDEWEKKEYDKNGRLIYLDTSRGWWEKYEYDKNGNRTYFENSNGYWEKKEYDENGNLIYFEDSVMVEYGRKALDKRPNKSSLS
jgi:YD repeat-containing protein